MALSLARSRTRWGLDILGRWPKRSCLPCTGSQVTQDAAISQLRKQWETIEQASRHPARKCRGWSVRSHLGLPPARRVTAMLALNDWQLLPEIAQHAHERASRLMGTQLLRRGWFQQTESHDEESSSI